MPSHRLLPPLVPPCPPLFVGALQNAAESQKRDETTAATRTAPVRAATHKNVLVQKPPFPHGLPSLALSRDGRTREHILHETAPRSDPPSIQHRAWRATILPCSFPRTHTPTARPLPLHSRTTDTHTAQRRAACSTVQQTTNEDRRPTDLTGCGCVFVCWLAAAPGAARGSASNVVHYTTPSLGCGATRAVPNLPFRRPSGVTRGTEHRRFCRTRAPILRGGACRERAVRPPACAVAPRARRRPQHHSHGAVAHPARPVQQTFRDRGTQGALVLLPLPSATSSQRGTHTQRARCGPCSITLQRTVTSRPRVVRLGPSAPFVQRPHRPLPRAGARGGRTLFCSHSPPSCHEAARGAPLAPSGFCGRPNCDCASPSASLARHRDYQRVCTRPSPGRRRSNRRPVARAASKPGVTQCAARCLRDVRAAPCFCSSRAHSVFAGASRRCRCVSDATSPRL